MARPRPVSRLRGLLRRPHGTRRGLALCVVSLAFGTVALAAPGAEDYQEAAVAARAVTSLPGGMRVRLADEAEPRVIPAWLLSRRVLEAIPAAELRELVEGATPASMQATAGEALGPIAAKVALGSQFGKSLFTPLPPCRVIDTRVTAGKLAAGETRRYTLRGDTTDYSAYGGVAGGCGIPDPVSVCSGNLPTTFNQAAALVLNVTAVAPEGAGHLEVWPGNHPEPAGSRLSYDKPPSSDLANEVIAAMCDETVLFGCNDLCPGGDIAISASGAASHVVVDVVGIFTGLERLELQAQPRSRLTTADLVLTGNCQEYPGLSLCFSASTAGTLFAEAELDCHVDHQYGGHDVMSFVLSDAAAGCVATDSDWRWPSTLPTGLYDTQVVVMREFQLGAGDVLCISPRGRMLQGATANDRCTQGRLRGVFYPDAN